MVRIILARPGATDFDDQRRIQGTLGLPLNATGEQQANQMAQEIARLEPEIVYASPERCAEQTAERMAAERVKVKKVKELCNLNYGLWHGKRIEEVRQQQPKVYRQWQDRPETICPPEGESLGSAQERVRKAISKLLKKHREGTIALVISEPLASLVRSHLTASEVGDLWDAECICGQWETIEVEPEKLVA